MNFNFDATKWALDQLPSLPNSSTRLVFLNLAGRWNDAEGASRPGIARIAADLGSTPRTVQRALRNLEQIGILRTQPSHNNPSTYLLNFDFLGAGVGDKKSPQNKKVELGVTERQAGGDFLSPPGVTKSRPNKSVNKLLNKQPPVVVGEIIWEKPLAEDEKRGCEQVLAGRADAQKFADELAGAGRVRPISNPAGWLRAVLKNSSRANFCFEHAERVAAARAARAAQAERESLALPPPPARLAVPPPPRELTEVGRASILAARAALASPPLVNRQPPVSPGATSAHTLATSTPAAAPP